MVSKHYVKNQPGFELVYKNTGYSKLLADFGGRMVGIKPGSRYCVV
jgi:hypothetical protein